jgi:hypothetical protein
MRGENWLLASDELDLPCCIAAEASTRVSGNNRLATPDIPTGVAYQQYTILCCSPMHAGGDWRCAALVP